MGRKPQVQARIPEDLKASLDEYCEQNELSQSDAVRRALNKEYGNVNVARQTHTIRTFLIMMSAFVGGLAGAGL